MMRRGMRPLLCNQRITLAELSPTVPFREGLESFGAGVDTILVVKPHLGYRMNMSTDVVDLEDLHYLPGVDILTTPFPDLRNEWRNITCGDVRPRCIITWAGRAPDPRKLALWHRFAKAHGYLTAKYIMKYEDFGMNLWYSVSSFVPYRGHGWPRLGEDPAGPEMCATNIVYGLIESGIIGADAMDVARSFKYQSSS